MNLPEFLKQIDEAAKDMTKEMLAGFVHERARMLPESQRDDYLAQIHSIAFMKSEAAVTEKKDMERSYTQNDVEDVLRQLEQIEEGAYFLSEEYNEEYDDWYHSDVPEILYGDPDGLLNYVQDGIRLVHQCIDCEDYKNAYILSEALSLMEVQTDGEHAGEALSLSELYANRLIVFDNKLFVLEALYSAYMANELDERSDAIFRMFYNNQYLEDASLEDVMQFAPCELPDFSGFIKRWIFYLGERKGRLEERLFSEAITLQNDRMSEIENARKYVAAHPGIYLKLLQENPGNAENQEQLELGKEALGMVDKKYYEAGNGIIPFIPLPGKTAFSRLPVHVQKSGLLSENNERVI